MWSSAWNKRKLTSDISNRILPNSVRRAWDCWSGGHGFKPHWGQFLTKSILCCLTLDLSDNLTEMRLIGLTWKTQIYAQEWNEVPSLQVSSGSQAALCSSCSLQKCTHYSMCTRIQKLQKHSSFSVIGFIFDRFCRFYRIMKELKKSKMLPHWEVNPGLLCPACYCLSWFPHLLEVSECN